MKIVRDEKGRFVKGCKGKLSLTWKGGKPKCIDCGKQLANVYAKRCQKHAAKINPQLQKGAYRKPHPGISYRGMGWKHSEATKAKMKGENNKHWKGELVGYRTLHNWVTRNLGKPEVCEHCLGTGKRLNWANIDHQYKRNLDDWIRLCVPCHKEYDGRGI